MAYEPTRSTNSVMRATKASRWKRSNCSQVVKRAGVDDAVEEQHPVEVVALVLEGPGRQPPLHLVVLDAVAVEVADPHVDVAEHVAPQVRAPTGNPR